MIKWLRWYNSYIVRRQKSRQSPELDQVFEQAGLAYNQAVSLMEQQWPLSRYRWRYDPKKDLLLFTHGKGQLAPLQGQAQIIGSFFHHTAQWHWAWSTPHVSRKSTQDARRTRRFGRQQGVLPFYTPILNLHGRPQDCQYLAAMTLHLSTADFVYIGRGQQQDVYFTLKGLSATLLS